MASVWHFRPPFQIAVGLLSSTDHQQTNLSTASWTPPNCHTWYPSWPTMDSPEIYDILHPPFNLPYSYPAAAILLTHNRQTELWHFRTPLQFAMPILPVQTQILPPGYMAFRTPSLICRTTSCPDPGRFAPLAVWHFRPPSPICHTLFCPDQDLIPCPRLDFLLSVTLQMYLELL